MRVLLLTSELYPAFTGGLGIAVYEIVRNMRRRHPQVEFSIIIPKVGWKGSLDAEVIELGSKVVSTYFSPITGALDTETYRGIKKYNDEVAEVALEKVTFDLIYAQDWLTALAGIKLKKLTKKPFIIHIHSTEYDRTNFHPRKWVVAIEKKAMEVADAVIVPSRRVKDQISQLYGIPENKIFVAYNGINYERFRSMKQVSKKFKHIVFFIGRLTIMKGVWQLLHAAKIVVQHMPDVKFVIAGTGPDYEQLVKLTVDLGIEKNVLFLGRISEEEKIAIFNMADVCVMPSVYEPFGIVALESLASGKPLIVSKTSGAAEVIENAFKVDYWDIEMLASRILEILSYEELKELMGKNGLREVKNLGWDRTAEQIYEVFRRVAKW